MRLQQLRREELSEVRALVPPDVEVVHVDLPQLAHHVQLEVLVVDAVVAGRGERERVSDLKPGKENVLGFGQFLMTFLGEFEVVMKRRTYLESETRPRSAPWATPLSPVVEVTSWQCLISFIIT